MAWVLRVRVGMSSSARAGVRQILAAGVFAFGCLGACATLLWLVIDGFALGFALQVGGWVVAMEIEER